MSIDVLERGDPQVAEEFMPIIHLVFSNLKTWLRGIHQGVSPQHLQAYLNEFTFRFNRRFYPFNAFRSLLGIAGDVTALTYAGLYAAKSRTTTLHLVGGCDNRISTVYSSYTPIEMGQSKLQCISSEVAENAELLWLKRASGCSAGLGE